MYGQYVWLIWRHLIVTVSSGHTWVCFIFSVSLVLLSTYLSSVKSVLINYNSSRRPHTRFWVCLLYLSTFLFLVSPTPIRYWLALKFFCASKSTIWCYLHLGLWTPQAAAGDNINLCLHLSCFWQSLWPRLTWNSRRSSCLHRRPPKY